VLRQNFFAGKAENHQPDPKGQLHFSEEKTLMRSKRSLNTGGDVSSTQLTDSLPEKSGIGGKAEDGDARSTRKCRGGEDLTGRNRVLPSLLGRERRPRTPGVFGAFPS